MTTPVGLTWVVRVVAEDKLADIGKPELIDAGACDEMVVVLAKGAVMFAAGAVAFKSGLHTPHAGWQFSPA